MRQEGREERGESFPEKRKKLGCLHPCCPLIHEGGEIKKKVRENRGGHKENNLLEAIEPGLTLSRQTWRGSQLQRRDLEMGVLGFDRATELAKYGKKTPGGEPETDERSLVKDHSPKPQ